jgi:hypothetical protein
MIREDDDIYSKVEVEIVKLLVLRGPKVESTSW